MTRRQILTSAAANTAAATAAVSKPTRLNAAQAITGLLDTTIERVERITITVPFRDVPAPHMHRTNAGNWTYNEIVKVHLKCGVSGFGENIQYFLENSGDDSRVIGKRAAAEMWDDSHGTGLQQAMFDAVGRANDVPIHRLLGRKVRDRAFMSWWAIDMPAEDWVKECRLAVGEGYTAFKAKARPWFDLEKQCAALTQILPPHFEMDFDFNRMLLDSGRAVPYCVGLERFPHVAAYETPIPQSDVEGNKVLRRKTRVPIAMHYGDPPIMTLLREEICDILIIGYGAANILQQGAVAAMANIPFWLQYVGTSITAAYTLHLAAVLSHARWPAVTCSRIYSEPLIKPDIKVENGSAAVPDSPGHGFDLDEDAVERLRTPRITVNPYPPAGLLHAIRWPSGATSYYAVAQDFYKDFEGGKLPVFVPGIHMETIPDDGSREWRELQTRARTGGIHLGGRPL